MSSVTDLFQDCKNQTYTCKDSDGGVKLDIKGTTTEYLNEQLTKTGIDECLISINQTASQLLEYSCSDSRLVSGKYSCSSGYTCSGGACVKTNSTTYFFFFSFLYFYLVFYTKRS